MKSTHTIVVPDGESSPQSIQVDTKRIINWNGRYHRAVEDADFVYFVNYNEGDENGQTMMYHKPKENSDKLELCADNYFASEHLFFNVMLAGKSTYLSKTAKYNLNLYKKENPNWEKELAELDID